MPHMTLPELACTLLLVRETYGWHRPWARLTRADFCKLTPIKSRATVGTAHRTSGEDNVFPGCLEFQFNGASRRDPTIH